MTERRFSPMFLAHGAPTLAIEETPAHLFLRSLEQDIGKPRYIVILSAHWETSGLKLSAPGPLRTYHDFRGFAPELHQIQYPAESDLDSVDEVAQVLEKAGFDIELDGQHGLDHGAWVPLSLVFPGADVPVVALSLPIGSTARSVHDLGRVLAPLAEARVLIIGTGSTTHNLREMSHQGAETPLWVSAFDTWLDKGLHAGSISCFDNLESGPDFRRNHPTDEHLLPLFFAFGAGGGLAQPELLHRSYEYGALSMSYYRFAV